MKKSTFSHFPIDSASILFLATIRKDHTNTFRFTMTLKDEICPDTLQKAVDRVHRRFPTIFAGFHPGFFQYQQIPSEMPPQVQPDPGCLHTMSREELRRCAYRVYYREKQIAIESFHALTDGYGSIASFTTLVAEYLRLRYDADIPVTHTLIDLQQSPMEQEVEDSFLEYAKGKPWHLPSRYAYMLPGGKDSRQQIWTKDYVLPTQAVLDASRKNGVSITTLISTLMASSIMEVQNQHPGKRQLPVRIMVPMDLRKMFPSRTLRNFVLYALPSLEPQDAGKPLPELLHSFADQIKQQLTREQLTSIMTYNVKTQQSWYFRCIPRSIKCGIMRIGYRFFGDSNSSLTVTNLGNVTLPPEMAAYVEQIGVILTPRMRSPYNCSVIAYNGQLTINISRFPLSSELEEIFSRKLHAALQEGAEG